jgi:hypothetical protein
MAVSIEGCKFESLSLTRDKETGQWNLGGSYTLISNTGVVLARQSINGYNDMKLEVSSESRQLMNALTASLQGDLNSVLGITEVKKGG